MLNTLIQWDCLIEMQKIPDKSIDMILCDLPYWTTACKWDNIIPFEPLWEQYKRIIKDNGAIVLTASQPFTSALVMSNIKMFKYCWVWEKSSVTGHLNAHRMPMRKHEDVLVFAPKRASYYPQDLKPYNKIKRRGHNGENYGLSGSYNFQEYTNYPRTIIKINNDPKPAHPTQKPVALFEYLIKTYTNEWDTVLDNCAGSWTTWVACKNTKRNYILIEQDEEYCNIIRKRLSTS